MFRAAIEYCSSLSNRFGQGWNRFWFTPSDVLAASVLRLVAGAAALFLVASHSGDLVRWFGTGGLLPQETITTVAGGRGSYRFSYFQFANTPAELWMWHGVGLAVTASFTLGLFSRVTNVLSLAVVLSYIHRAPLVAGPFEAVLCFLLAYLCLAPTGVYLSLDRRFKLNKTADRTNPITGRPPETVRSWTATVAMRLIQLHFAALIFMTALWMLGGAAWWNGEAIWIMMAQTRNRLVDWSFLRGAGYLVNIFSHLVVIFHLAFGVLIWNKTIRPLLLAISVVVWIGIGLVSMQAPYAALMLFAGLAFVSPESLRQWFGRRGASRRAQQRPTTAPAESEAIGAK